MWASLLPSRKTSIALTLAWHCSYTSEKYAQCRNPLPRAISSFDSLSPRGLGSYMQGRINGQN
jgi:hypothetical protein